MKYLEQICRGELHRLLIACPPGSAKSEICSVWMPAWYLANHPSNHVLCCGHTQELSERFARRVRNLVDEYSTQLGIALSPDSQAGGRWSLTAGGSLFALGVTGAITGYRADLVLVDDPFPNREDALNENNRRKVYDWMIGDVMPRLLPEMRVAGAVEIRSEPWRCCNHGWKPGLPRRIQAPSRALCLTGACVGPSESRTTEVR